MAETGLVGNAAGVGFERYAGVEAWGRWINGMRIEEGRGEILTGYVLGEKLGTLSESFWCFGIP